MEERKIWIGYPDGRDHQLWRYMGFLKFVDLLQQRSLWFARLDQLPDPYEGALTKPTAEFFAEVRSRTGFRGGIHHEKFRKVRCANCWHMSEYESAAMWDLYSSEAGVAVRSCITRLEKSFPADFTGGSWGVRGDGVRYVDYEMDKLAGLSKDGSVIMTADFMCKRKSFEHEHEYRLVTSLESDEHEKVGKHIPVLLAQLIEQIIVSPTAPKWVVELVRKEVLVHGFDVGVVQSDLYSPLLK